MIDIFEKCSKRAIQDDLRDQGIYPYFHYLETRQAPEVIMEGKRRIMLGSNNYLGLTTNPEVMEAAIKAVEQFGTGCSGSRFLNGTLKLHLELEEELAAFLHKDAVITFPSGFQSNLGIISALVGRNDYVILDREDHASIYDAARLGWGKMLRYHHDNMQELEECLKQVPADKGCLIVTDGVFSMSGGIANLPEICRLAKQYGARVMVDDAHGLGVLGEGGRGTANYYGLEDQVDIYMGTFSKSLASLGGYMAGNARIVDFVKHNSRPFMFAASIPPAQAAAALASLRYLKAHPEIVTRLNGLADRFRSELKAKGLNIIEAKTPIVPIFTYEAYRTLEKCRKIYDGGVYVNSVLPPAAPEGECMIRTSLMASLTDALVDEAAGIIAEAINND